MVLSDIAIIYTPLPLNLQNPRNFFRTQSRDGTPYGLTPNLEPYFLFTSS